MTPRPPFRRSAALASLLCLLAGASHAATGALDTIRSTGEITLAHRNASIPFSYLDANGQPIGYAMDVCLKLVDMLKHELKLPKLAVKYLLVTPDTRISAVVDGKAQLECGSTTNNAERRKKVDFTIPHFISTARFVARTDAHIDTVAQLAGQAVVTTKGTTNVNTLRRANNDKLLNMHIVEAQDHAQAFAMVTKGEAKAFAMDDVLLFGLRANTPKPEEYTVFGKPLSIEPYAIILPKDDAAFKKLIDQEMRRIILNGEITTLYTKWFLQPIPPKNVTMALPMSYMLKDSFKYPSDKVGELD